MQDSATAPITVGMVTLKLFRMYFPIGVFSNMAV